jgi:hypothetical protein
MAESETICWKRSHLVIAWRTGIESEKWTVWPFVSFCPLRWIGGMIAPFIWLFDRKQLSELPNRERLWPMDHQSPSDERISGAAQILHTGKLLLWMLAKLMGQIRLSHRFSHARWQSLRLCVREKIMRLKSLGLPTEVLPKHDELSIKTYYDGPIILLIDECVTHITPRVVTDGVSQKIIMSDWSYVLHTSLGCSTCLSSADSRCCSSVKRKLSKWKESC